VSYNAPQRSEISVSDGFRFGCGFMMAAAVAYLILIIVTFILYAVFWGLVLARFRY
jgi:hypothetical protein